MMIDVMGMVKNPAFLLKVVELLLSGICTGLISDKIMIGNVVDQQVIVATIIGYLLINILIIAGYCIGHPIHRFLVLGVTVSGAIMFLTTAALLFVAFDNGSSSIAIAAGVLAIGNTLVYCIDTFVTYKFGSSN